MVHFIKLLLKHITWLLIIPVVCATTVFVLTRKAKKEYSSFTTLYTGVASGYSITSTEDERLDYFAVNNAFDNLLASAKSRETIEQVALRLLAEHLALQKPDPKVLGADGFDNLHKAAGHELLAKAQQLKNSAAIYAYIQKLYSSSPDNKIEALLNQPGSFYNIDDLRANLVVTRITTSDIIQIVYNCSDPAVCQRTLQIHSEIFTANYRNLKSDQTNSAVQYFEAKLAEVKAKLQRSEDEMKEFGRQHHIINYYEQTRYIAQENEQLNREIYGQKIAQNAAANGMDMVEKKLHSRDKQIDNSTKLIDLRQRLSDASAGLERAKVFGDKSKIERLTAQTQTLEDSIKQASADYNNLNYTLETVPRNSLMQEWVDNAVNSGNAKAGLKVLGGEKREYQKNFDEFAPLGSTLKRLERQIDINEKEFLSILHGLELARLRQNNLSLNSNIAIQDKPFLPLKAQKSTRVLLVMVAFLVGFILTAGSIIGRELMDSSIRTPERAKKIVHLPLAGVSVLVNESWASAYNASLRQLLAEQMINVLLPLINASMAEKGSAQLTLLHNKAEAYQPQDIALFNNLFEELFGPVNWVVPASELPAFERSLPVSNYTAYTPSVALLNVSNIGQIAGSVAQNAKLVVYVAPNLAQHSLPLALTQNSCAGLVVVNANDTWLPVDKELLAKLKASLSGTPLYTWLVKTDESNLDNLVGELPRQRSWIRRKIKKIVTLNLR
ncbi:GumC family protein [Mucilaginibacter pedocola]|uniref:Polysaccharide chain length determinant N-terminal domain-containing protein n=1 Tax=Mucilaginibacter pedocola TaxID=1792845 RepID=A0A1S9P6Y2_9SPHI|nr:hypothetical protein [Mucilaginibacter pedocola]OOQ56710.1 hypothetical protein BC343_17085 [Mucilaginibacter pedocola]